jgi:hypothetical protein
MQRMLVYMVLILVAVTVIQVTANVNNNDESLVHWIVKRANGLCTERGLICGGSGQPKCCAGSQCKLKGTMKTIKTCQ